MEVTKQEQVRSWLDNWANDNCLYIDDGCNHMDTNDNGCSDIEGHYNCLMKRLKSHGVVIDEMESAKALGWEEGYRQGWEDARNEFVFPYAPPFDSGTTITTDDINHYQVWYS